MAQMYFEKVAQKTALVIGECNSNNVGDQAIAEAMHLALSERGYSVKHADYSCGIKGAQSINKTNNVIGWRTLKSKLVRILPRWVLGIKWALNNYRIIREVARDEYDLVVIGGGQLILANVNFPIALHLWVYFLAKKNENINIISCGVGESFSLIERFLIRKALRYVNRIYLRDARSIENAQRNFGVNAKYCPDIAYYLANSLTVAPKNKTFSVTGLSVIDYSVYIHYANEMSVEPLSEVDYLQVWKSRVYDLVNEGSSVILVSTTEADQRYSEQIFALINNDIRSRVALYAKASSWKDFVDQISTCKSFISGRMHGLILAHLSGVEPIPYLVSKKVEAFSIEYLNESTNIIFEAITLVVDEIALRKR